MNVINSDRKNDFYVAEEEQRMPGTDTNSASRRSLASSIEFNF
jgi:hypothetical protein